MEATTLQVYDVIGTWIAAIGTVGAVITSLWLSFNSNKVKLKIDTSASILIHPSIQERGMHCIITISNIGTRPVTIKGIGWEIQRGNEKKNFIQMTWTTTKGNLPLFLQEGEVTDVIIPNQNEDGFWFTQMAKETKGFLVQDLKVVISTSSNSFKVKIDDSLAKEIQKERKIIADQEEST